MSLEQARAFRDRGLLGHALRATEAATRSCPSRDADLEHARALADIGLDQAAIAAWRRWASTGDADDRRRAAAEVAALGRRPPPRRDATPDETGRALALYRDGVDRRLAGQADAAITQLRRSYALRPHPLTIVQIALAHRAAGREVEYNAACARALAIAEYLAGTRAVPVARLGHHDSVTALAFDRAGRLLASGDHAGALLVWDLASGRILQQLPPQPEAIAAVQLSRDGHRLVSATTDGNVQVWDVPSASLVRSFAAGREPIAIDDDATRVAAGSDTIQLWDATTATPVGTQLRAPAGRITALAFQPGGALLAAAAASGEVVAWDLGDWTRVRSFEGRAPDVRVLTFSGTGLILMAAGGNGGVTAWSAADGRAIPAQPAGSKVGMIAALDADGSVAAAREGERGLHAWDRSTGQPRAVERTTTDQQVSWVRFAPSGSLLAIGDSAGGIDVVDVAGGGPARALGNRLRPVRALAVDPRSGRVAVGSWNERVFALWTPGTRTGLRRLRAEYPLASLGFASDGRLMSAASNFGENQGEVAFWNPADGARIRSFPWNSMARAVPVPPDRALVVDLDAFGKYQVSLADDGRRIRQFPDDGDVRAVALSADGTRMAYAGNGFLALGPVDADPQLTQLRALAGYPINAHALAFDPGGGRVVVGTMEGIELRSSTDGSLLRSFPLTEAAYFVATTGDRVVGSTAGRQLLWLDLASGAVAVSRSPQGLVTGLAFDRTATRLLTAGADGTVGLWNATDRTLLGRLIATERGWMVLSTGGAVEGDLDEAEQTTYLQWQVGPYQLPGFVAWQREQTPGLAAQLLAHEERP